MSYPKITLFAVTAAVVCASAFVTFPRAQPPDFDGGQHASGRRFDLQAHRGGMGEVQPGNSLPSFERALDLQVDTLEMDVRVTADGVIVVVHEGQLVSPWSQQRGPDNRNRQQSGRNRVSALSVRQLKEYQHPVRPSPKRLPKGFSKGIHLGKCCFTTVPTLEEVFQFTHDFAQSDSKSPQQRQHAARVRFCIEMKQPGFEKAIVELITKRQIVDRVIIQSFNFDSLGCISEINPKISTMALSFLPVEPRDIAERTQATYWAPNGSFLTLSKTRSAQQLGLLVVPWTVNGDQALEQFISWGVDGVMTDYPKAAIKKLDDMKVHRLSD